MIYYMRIQRTVGSDYEFKGSLGECIKRIVNFMTIEHHNYRGHFILRQK